MVGIQGSGKSTQAKILAEEYGNTIIISSDRIRKDYPELRNDNNKVFDKFYADINYHLRHGSNVIADATNISLSGRNKLLKATRVPCEKIAYVMNTSYEECRYRVCRRNIECCKEKLKENLSAKEIQMWEERLLENQSALKEFE